MDLESQLDSVLSNIYSVSVWLRHDEIKHRHFWLQMCRLFVYAFEMLTTKIVLLSK